MGNEGTSAEAERPELRGQRACAFCGRAFVRTVPGAKYCNPVCRLKANAAQRGMARQFTGARGSPRPIDIPVGDPPPWAEEWSQ